MVQHIFFDVLTVLWLAWGGYWIASVIYEGATERTKETKKRVPSTGFVFFFLLFFMLTPIGFAGTLGSLYLPSSEALKTFGLLVTAGGVASAIWARRHLGSNWSGVPSLKVGHTLITTGPYSVVRHPIYTGILTGMVGSTLVLGTYGSLFVLVLSSALVWVRIRQEEGLMKGEFGDAYQDYRKRTKTIIPWVL